MSAFITDSGYRHTLGIVRSLGSKKITLDVGSPSIHPSACSLSKYHRKTMVYPDPKEKTLDFIKFFHRLPLVSDTRVVIPVGYNTTFFLSKNKDTFSRSLKLPIADFSSLKIAANKHSTLLLANEIDVPSPRTLFPMRSYECNIKPLGFPIVVKGVAEAGFVRYAYSQADFNQKFDEIMELQGVPPIVQEYIKGDGYGFFALFNQGRPRAVFMHRRIRERSTMGGASTCAESTYNQKLMQYGLAILKRLNWHGIAMVEFKKDSKDGEFKLMEINPKFWGSLDLSIASGVDFPYLLYKMAIDGDVSPVFHYKQGVKFMWPFPDDFLRSLNSIFDMKHFLNDLFNSKVKKNIDLLDPKPALAPILYLISRW